MKKILSLILVFLAAATLANAKSPKAKHVVLIGLDGWGAYSVPKATNIPNLQSMMQGGAYTLHKRSVMNTSSAINWASMFNGAPTELHGYTKWNSRTPEVPSACVNQRGIYPTIFSLLREHQPKAETCCIAEWDGIKYLVDSLAINYVAVASNYEKDPEQLTRMAEQYIREKRPTLAAVCYDQIDHTGHGFGHDTPDYYKTLSFIDTQIGRIIQATKDAGIYDETVFIVTSDHGGIGTGHGNMSMQELEVPFIICGKNIKQGMVITDVMIQYDTAATIAEIFNLPFPQCWRGRPAYSVFKK